MSTICIHRAASGDSPPTFLVLHADEPGRTTTSTKSGGQSAHAGPDDGEDRVRHARALEQGHYRQHRLNSDYSEKFFLTNASNRWIPACILPGRPEQFASYRTNLDNLTITRSAG